MAATTTSDTDADSHLESAPAPWTNKGEVYFFFLSTPGKLPEGAYAPLEANSYFASPEAGTFRGGAGNATVQVVRYTDSPVGPYDELIYAPGTFDNPSGKPKMRITRIYVSTDASIYNGRKNWNVCKHLARFTFTPLRSLHDTNLATAVNPQCPIKIDVFPPTPRASSSSTRADRSSSPFFSAIVTPSTWLPNFPFNTRYLPQDLLLIHPPLPASRGHDDDDDAASSVVGTDHWISILPSMAGTGEVVWYAPCGRANEGHQSDEGVQPGEYADGVGFPKFHPWRMGIHVKNLVLHFPEGQPVVDDKKKSV